MMSIRLVIGRAGSGKTARCLQEISERLEKEPLGPPLILLVPEQATFQAEYALIRKPGISGTIRAQVLSFRRLAFRVLQETGGTARVPITETGKKMLIYRIVRHVNKQLKIFRHADEQMGAIDNLHDIINEFKRYLLDPQKLQSHADTYQNFFKERSHLLADKLQDLTLIYSHLEQALSGLYVDSEDLLTMLASAVEDSHYLAQAEIWIDGFHGFTPQEYAVIAQLMKKCIKVNLSLCADRIYQPQENPDELDLFYPTADTMIKLRSMAAEHNVAQEVPLLLQRDPLPRFRRSPALQHLEQAGDGVVPWQSSCENGERPLGEQITVQAAVHRRAEVEAAAREILRLVRDGGYRWRDIAIVIRNGEDYQDLLETVLADFGIPYFFDQKRPVVHHPLVELIRSALEIVNGNWRYDAVFRAVKTDFFDSPTAAHENGGDKQKDGSGKTFGDYRSRMDKLENYVLAFGIQGSRWTNPEKWSYQLYRSLDDDRPETVKSADLEQIHRDRMRIVTPLKAFQESLKQADSVKAMCEALYRLLIDLRVPAALDRWSRACLRDGQAEKAREHAAIWDSVITVIDQLVEMLGEEKIGAELFAGILETGLDSIRLGLVPPALDQVLIGSIDRSRSSEVKCCFLLGANDGVLPARFEEGGAISELEREWLERTGLGLAPGNKRRLLDERFLIYTAFSIPSDRLWISYPLADEEGRALLPSQVIRRLKRMYSSIEGDLIVGEPEGAAAAEEQLEYVQHPARSLSYLTVQLRRWKKGVPLSPMWWQLYNWFCANSAWKNGLELMNRGLFFANHERPLSYATSLLLYGQQLQASVSRMEKFAACPFSHFASYGLKLRERGVYRLEAPDVGQLFHAALRMIADQLGKERLHWGELSRRECLERAYAAVEALSPRLQNEILLSTNRYRYVARKLKETVGRASVVLGEHARRSGFQPHGLELDFGAGASVPPLKFELNHGFSMEVAGRIDRVDRAEDEHAVYFRVIDYKSGDKALRLPEVYYGLSMQMLTYLDVMVTHAERAATKKIVPAGVLYFHVHNPLLALNGKTDEEDAEKMLFKRFKMKGLVLADAEVIRLMDGAMEKRSEIIPVGMSENGQIYKNSSVYSPGQWQTLRRHIRSSIRETGTAITEGVVDIRPYRMGKKTPCTFCGFKAVCQFESAFDGNAYRNLQAKDEDALWQAMPAGAEPENPAEPEINGGGIDAADRA